MVDIGNTSIKFLPLNKFQEVPHRTASLTEFEIWLASHPHITTLFLASVRQADEINRLEVYCKSNNLLIQRIQTKQHDFGLTNSYKNVSMMGVDRWLAMIAAVHLTDKPFIVIDAGTAITVDFAGDGRHLGGWIAPGFVAMRSALLASTQKVYSDNVIPDCLQLGTHTESGVANGCMAAVQGIYCRAKAYMSDNYEDFDIFITGGDKNLFAFSQNDGSILAANLVVQGLARYAKKHFFA
nr:type III pantothenate kinase [Alteromonas sp. ASW11-130]